jgi:phospholipase C
MRIDMKLPANVLFLLLLSGTIVAQSHLERPKSAAFPSQITNVVVIVQENRTPDNLFQALKPLCTIPVGASGLNACTPSPVTSSCYDIAPCGVSNQNGLQAVPLASIMLNGPIDPNHGHENFVQMCDPDAKKGYACRNDGAWHNLQGSYPGQGIAYSYVDDIPVTNYNGSSGYLLDPYVTFAETYGWANYMYQTNQGPSYPAHQFLFSGTSALSFTDDQSSTFIAENFVPSTSPAGCLATAKATNKLISPLLPGATECTGGITWDAKSIQECPITNTLVGSVGSFCSYKDTMATWLDSNVPQITWKYYAPSAGKIWTAPDSIYSICDPQFEPDSDTLYCAGMEWATNVDVKNMGTDILTDITNCKLNQVSWVIPDGAWSDHAGATGNYGPSWVAAVINEIGQNPTCAAGTPDAGQTFWNNTAIVVTWDDWGGWSDNQPPPILSALPCTSDSCQGDYQYGFRVPLIVVSAYTPSTIDSTNIYDFGSILRMIEGIYGIDEGVLGVADARNTTDLSAFFPGPYRSYTPVPAIEPASYFTSEKVQSRKPIPPDNDGDED